MRHFKGSHGSDALSRAPSSWAQQGLFGEGKGQTPWALWVSDTGWVPGGGQGQPWAAQQGVTQDRLNQPRLALCPEQTGTPQSFLCLARAFEAPLGAASYRKPSSTALPQPGFHSEGFAFSEPAAQPAPSSVWLRSSSGPLIVTRVPKPYEGFALKNKKKKDQAAQIPCSLSNKVTVTHPV